VDFCNTTELEPWPVSDDVSIGRVNCSTPTIAGFATINNESDLKSIDATLTQAPGGVAGIVLAVYGLDANQGVVCQIADPISSGASSVVCPASAVSWIARIEN
jgi:hypothetical protein